MGSKHGNLGGRQSADSGNDYQNYPGDVREPEKAPYTYDSWESGKNKNKTSHQHKRDVDDIPENVDEESLAPWFNFTSPAKRGMTDMNNPINSSEYQPDLALTHMDPEQLRNLIEYHAANARFHNTQASLIKNNLLEFGVNSQFEPHFNKMHDYHNKMAARHRHVAENLFSKATP